MDTIKDIATRNIIKLVFGTDSRELMSDFETQDGKITKVPFHKLVGDCFHESFTDYYTNPLSLFFGNIRTKMGIGKERARLNRNEMSMRNDIRKLVENRKKGPKPERKDMLMMFLEDSSYDNKLDDLVDDLAIFLFTGNDTAAYTTTATYHRLAECPEVKEKLMVEIKSKLPSGWTKDNLGSVLNKDILNDMPYLNAVIKEVMRFETIAPLSLTY